MAMWTTLDRTRRRLLRLGMPADPVAVEASTDPGSALGDASEPAADIVLAIGRPELDRLGLALQDLLGPDIARPDTPDRLEAALAAAVAHLGGAGQPHVIRRPAGLYTPEAWQVHLETGEPAVVEAIRRAIREGVFAA
jgi:hypothetical protein